MISAAMQHCIKGGDRCQLVRVCSVQASGVGGTMSGAEFGFRRFRPDRSSRLPRLDHDHDPLPRPDPLGHINNSVYSEWFEAARVMLTRKFSATGPDWLLTALARMTINFLAEIDLARRRAGWREVARHRQPLLPLGLRRVSRRSLPCDRGVRERLVRPRGAPLRRAARRGPSAPWKPSCAALPE